jgi:hypothetical protein
MSVSSFDFDKFSLSSEGNDKHTDDYDDVYNEEYGENPDDNTRIKNYTYDVEKEKEKKEQNANSFLSLLETQAKENNEKKKYMTCVADYQIPKYIIGSRTNKPCVNCKINIEQKINLSFIKILETNYFFCFTCREKFLININSLIEKKFIEMKTNNSFSCPLSHTNEQELGKFEKLIASQKYNLNKFAFFLENYFSINQVKEIINIVAQVAFDDIKFIKPYPNIKIYDFDMSDFRFTNESRIKSLLKTNFITKIDDTNYKFTNEEFGNHYEYKAKADNKCICCGTELNLIKFKLASTSQNLQINHIVKKYENLKYLLYAVCTNCKKKCDRIQISCIKYFLELEHKKNLKEVVEVEKERDNLVNFFKNYNDKFFELLGTECLMCSDILCKK